MIFTSNPLYDIFKEIKHQLGGKNLVGEYQDPNFQAMGHFDEGIYDKGSLNYS